jgi:hypothetical protein
VPVTAYANTSLDVAQIIRSISKSKPDWATALDIYVNGKNSFRNIETGIMRIMSLVMERNYGKEEYFAAAQAYYGEVTYASRPLSDALTASGDFADGAKWGCCGVRQGYASALSRFYGPLYFYHEADAGVLKAAKGDLQAAFDELDDAVACLLAPRVVSKGGNLKISGRVAPSYNFWDWSTKIAKGACAVKSGKADTTKKLMATFKASKAIVDPATTTDPVAASIAYAAKAIEASRDIATTFVRASLASAKSAGSTYRKRATATKCSSSCGVSKMHLAQAHAYWYIAESALARLGAPADQLKAVRDMVDPSLVSAGRKTFSTFAAAVRQVVEGAGLSYRKDVFLC